MHALDEKEAAQLFKAARETRLYFPILLAVATGMRRGEILGLRWSDVDIERGVLSVCQSLEQTKAGLTFKEPKTRKARSVIALPPLAVEALRKRKAEQARQRLLLGPAYQESGLVCAKEDGGPIAPADLSKSFAMLVRKRGVLEQPVRFHDLRHSHATQLLRQGVRPKVVSERLGHSTVGITLDTYSHVLPGLQEEAAQKVDAALRAAIKKLR